MIPHAVPLHVATPFAGIGHGLLHEVVPQVAVLVLLEQLFAAHEW
jgi:hypothetical protein